MKILEIIPDLKSRGGAEVFFDALCKELSKDNNLKITVIVIWDKIDKSFSHLINNTNIKFFCCGKKKRGIDFKAIKKFKSFVLSENPDVIHTHRSVLLTYFMSFGLKRQKWKFYHTIHNVANKEAGRYEILLRKLFLKHKLVFNIGISESISKSITSLYKVEPIATIYNGISFNPSPSLSKKYDFICVARFSKQKNHIFLLKCFNELIKTFPDLTLFLVGDGELQAECKDYCLHNGLNENVTFYGSTPFVAPLLGESRIFVLGSLYEGNPISILEAMSSGLPIIAPRVGGIPDVVIEPDNGFLFEPNNNEQLVEIMKTVISDSELQNNISRKNRLKMEEFSMAKCANYYKRLFNINK